jgi:hypothetical protein
MCKEWCRNDQLSLLLRPEGIINKAWSRMTGSALNAANQDISEHLVQNSWELDVDVVRAGVVEVMDVLEMDDLVVKVGA